MEALKEPRLPVQKRSRDRVKKILDAAEAIIAESGWGAATSHAIAKRAGVPPAGVYHFFPDRYMIYDALTERNSQEFGDAFPDKMSQADIQAWPDIINLFIDLINDYCVSNKAARELSFGCDGEYETRWSTSTHHASLSESLRVLYCHHFDLKNIDRLPTKFDLMADFVVTGFTQAVKNGDPVNYEILDEMRHAVVAYIASWIGDPKRLVASELE
jgi:AcrR family transcriptional regulator